MRRRRIQKSVCISRRSSDSLPQFGCPWRGKGGEGGRTTHYLINEGSFGIDNLKYRRAIAELEMCCDPQRTDVSSEDGRWFLGIRLTKLLEIPCGSRDFDFGGLRPMVRLRASDADDLSSSSRCLRPITHHSLLPMYISCTRCLPYAS